MSTPRNCGEPFKRRLHGPKAGRVGAQATYYANSMLWSCGSHKVKQQTFGDVGGWPVGRTKGVRV